MLEKLKGVYGSLDESIAHRVIHLNIWCPVDSIIQGGSGGVAVWEEVCPWGGPGEFKDSHHFQFFLYIEYLIFQM